MKLFLAFCLLATTLIAAPSPTPVGQKFVYKTVGNRELSLYVTKPEGWKATDKRPAMVFFHGGGWVGGGPGLFNEQSKSLASRGMVCASVEYRLLDKNKQEPPITCIQDAKSAMRWVRSHAGELGIDPSRIGAAGGSAGGHLAAFCGMVEGMDDPKDDLSISPRPKVLVLFNPVFNNGPGQWGHARVGDRYTEFSPAHNITADDPPSIIFLGSEDALISVETNKQFQDEMQELGIKCELHVYQGQKHGFYNNGTEKGKYVRLTMKEADRFLVELGWLKPAL